MIEARAIRVEKPFAAAEEKFSELVEVLKADQSQRMTHGELETLVDFAGREIQRRLLQGHLDLRTANEKRERSVTGADGKERTHCRERARKLMTVFGLVTVQRMSYGGRGEDSLSPIDAVLNLPAELHSHGLRHLAAVEGARGSFDEAVKAIERCSGTMVAKRQVEQLVERAAFDFDDFYAESARELLNTKDLLVLSLDGKGIVMRHKDLTLDTQRVAEKSQPKLNHRLSHGEKRGRKRMATVAAIYDLEAVARTAADVISELRPARDVTNSRPRAHNKRVWASLKKSAHEVTCELFDDAQRRDPLQKRRWVVLVDGNNHQIFDVETAAKGRGLKITLVVDFIHVLEYLWNAAWSFFGDGDKNAERWVTERAIKILQGKSSEVGAGIRRSATLRGLSIDKRRNADKCADYLISKRQMLRYDVYLAQGFPIATGIIEGACRHLIKDRMDITGARWSLAGAEAVLRLRSLRSSGDFEEYWPVHLQAERQRQHLSLYAPQQHQRDARPGLRVLPGGLSS